MRYDISIHTHGATACSWQCVMSKLSFEVRVVAGGGPWRADLVGWLDSALQLGLGEAGGETGGHSRCLEFLVGARLSSLVQSIEEGRPFRVCSIIVVGPHFTPADKAALLMAGADDVIDLDTGQEELVARIGAIGRRYASCHDCAALGRRRGAEPPTPDNIVAREGLTQRERSIVNNLIDAGGNIVRYASFGDADEATCNSPRHLHYHVTSIRKKMGRACTIENIRGVGYRMARKDS